MILLLLVAVASVIALFLMLWQFGMALALTGASLGGALVTGLAAVLLAYWRQRRQRPDGELSLGSL